MDEGSDFTTILRRFMAQARRSPTDLERLAGISARTIENWTAGVVRRPRELADVLKVARALGLGAPDTTTLLCAAGYPPLAALWAQAQRADDGELRPLLAAWPSAAPTASPTRRAQLRAPVTDFVGRADAISTLATTLRRATQGGAIAAISGVQGMGGIGKTELAFLVAHQLADAYPDAQIVVNLRGTSPLPLTAEQALQQIVHTFAPNEQLPEDLDALQQRTYTLLHGQRVLILADDAHDAAQVRPLLPPPGCALLVTSRQRFTLPGMVTIDLEQLREDEAVRLLHTICPRLRADEARTIARACGYLPLALRVSGSILHNDPALLVADYMGRLADERQRLSQLRDPDDGQLDVEASLALSYARLDALAQRVFRQLGVLVADFATGLALAVVEVEAERDVEAPLHRLLRRNLVMYDAARARWRLHDLVRDLARHELAAAREQEATMWRYAHAAVRMAQAAQDHYWAGQGDELDALAQFDAERPHLDAALHWAMVHAGMPAGDQLLLAEAGATRHLGELRYDVRRERIPQLEAALAAAQRLGDRRSAQYILNNFGIAYGRLGDLRRAIPYFEQSLAVARDLSDRFNERVVLTNLGSTYNERGDAVQAIPYFEQALTAVQELGDRRGEAIVLSNLGESYAMLGEGQRAVEVGMRALAIAQGIQAHHQEGYALYVVGAGYVALNDRANAARAFEEALTLFHAVGDRYGEAMCQWAFGLALISWGKHEQALPLLCAAVAYEEDIGHAQATEHAALLARLETGQDVPEEMLRPAYQRAIGVEGTVPTDDGV